VIQKVIKVVSKASIIFARRRKRRKKKRRKKRKRVGVCFGGSGAIALGRTAFI
jgi:hypothetical protein